MEMDLVCLCCIELFFPGGQQGLKGLQSPCLAVNFSHKLSRNVDPVTIGLLLLLGLVKQRQPRRKVPFNANMVRPDPAKHARTELEGGLMWGEGGQVGIFQEGFSGKGPRTKQQGERKTKLH